MKKFYTVLAACLALTFAGCSIENPNSGNSSYSSTSSTKIPEISQKSSENSSENSTISSDENSTEENSEPQEPEDPEANDLPSDFLVGLAGDKIPAENFITDMTGITRKNFHGCDVKGTYVAMPSGIFRTSLDNPDVFDEENSRFTDIPEEKKKDYIRVEEGDKICGFKVKNAISYFSPFFAMGTQLSIPEIYFNYGELELEGVVEMMGYISIAAEDVYGVNAGDIRFIPTECKPALPVLKYIFDPAEGFYRKTGLCYMDGGIVYTNEYGCGCFRLGNKSETTTDISDIPTDGSFIKAKIVVKNISMICSIDQYTKVSGELMSVQAVP